MRNRLGDTVSGAALGGVHGTAQTNLGLAQGLGDTKAGYSALGTVKKDARNAIPKAIAAKQGEGVRKSNPKFIENAQKAVDELLTDRNKSVQKKGADYQKQLDKLDADFQATSAITPKKELDQLQSSIESLLRDALKAGYGTGYEDIIKDRRAKARCACRRSSSTSICSAANGSPRILVTGCRNGRSSKPPSVAYSTAASARRQHAACSTMSRRLRLAGAAGEAIVRRSRPQ